ncbi:cation channel sperm-associated auxiliary subunit zeta [Apteryx mantelli]|uniref:Cation channel sperm-associated auxiliary subunit zeta n=1 Tax=Apteryx mantelli TaxID=2696672 RepID=A0ABM4G8Q8_9AVES
MAEHLEGAGPARGGTPQSHRPPRTPEELVKDPRFLRHLRRHHLNLKVTIPQPLRELMETEALAILGDTLEAYRGRLGRGHPLTQELEQRRGELDPRGPPPPRPDPPKSSPEPPTTSRDPRRPPWTPPNPPSGAQGSPAPRVDSEA